MIVLLNFLPPTLDYEKLQKSKMDHLEAIDALRKELKENPRVDEEITQIYQVDLEVIIHNEVYVSNIRESNNIVYKLMTLQKFKCSSYIITLETAPQGVHRTCRMLEPVEIHSWLIELKVECFT